MIVRSHGP